LRLEVFNKSKNLIAEKHIEGVHFSQDSLSDILTLKSSSNAQTAVPIVLQQKLEQLFNDKKIINSL